LLTGLDHAPDETLNSRRRGRGNAPPGHERHESIHAEFREFLDEPLLPLPLRQGYRQGQRRPIPEGTGPGAAQFQADFVTADRHHPCLPRCAPAIEDDYLVADAMPHHLGKVSSLTSGEPSMAVAGRRLEVETFAHGISTIGFKPVRNRENRGQVAPDPMRTHGYTPAMVRDRLQLAAAAFDGTIDPAHFHAGPAEEEALARLEWLVLERGRCGLVVAEEGLGKSHLLAMAARRCGGLGAEVATLSLHGLPAGAWLDLLLARLPLDAASRGETDRPWLVLENRIRENTLMERPTVLAFDDVDRGPTDALDGISRLAAAGEPRFGSLVVVVTASPLGLARVPAAVCNRSAVRIDLAPWDETAVAAFMTATLVRAGGDPECFSDAAMATIARFTEGVPRMVCRLARLAALASADGSLERVDAATVERAWRDLLPAEPARRRRDAV